MTRRDLIKGGLFASAAMALPLQRLVSGAVAARMPSSKLPKPFTTPFAAPPVAVPVRQDDTTDYYYMSMRAVQKEIVPGYQTTYFAYEGSVPGPTIQVNQGRKVVVRHCNRLPGQHPTLGYEPWTSVHLHGSASLPQFDGYASDITRPGGFKDYHYPNFQQARTLWYHDHGVHHTAENAYMGCAAQYQMFDPLEQSLPIPHGAYDVPLVLSDAMFDVNGQLRFSLVDESGMWGDVIMVNGRPWPVMQVERRKYRFRVLAAAISRSWGLSLDTGDQFTVIGTDAGLMPLPVKVQRLKMGPAERYEIVIDFAKYPVGKRVVLRNASPKNNVDYTNTNRVMAFDVIDGVTSAANNSIPDVLNPNEPVMQLRPEQAVRTRTLNFHRTNGEWKINNQTWKDVESSNYQATLAQPNRGDVEIWELSNLSGGWFHPVHIHLIDFQILSRNGLPPAPYERGPKDVVYVGETETVRVLAKFEGRGKYMIHCHNLSHEDHDMMGQFEVIDPEGPGDDPFSAPPHSLDDEGDYEL